MTQDEAVAWFERQGMKVRVFGESIHVVFGEPVPTAGNPEIRIYPAMATLHREDDATWRIVDHGVDVGSAHDLENAVVAARDYLLRRLPSQER